MSIEVMRKLADAYKQVNEKKKKLDPVDKDELKGSHADRDDKDIDNDGDADSSDEFLHKKRKAISKNMKKKGKDEDVSMNPKMNKGKESKASDNDTMAQESTLPPVYTRILEKRHGSEGAPKEKWDEKEKNNKGAMDMRKDMKAGNPDIVDNPESEKIKDPSKKAPLRPGDNAKGDKNIIPSATPAKGN